MHIITNSQVNHYRFKLSQHGTKSLKWLKTTEKTFIYRTFLDQKISIIQVHYEERYENMRYFANKGNYRPKRYFVEKSVVISKSDIKVKRDFALARFSTVIEGSNPYRRNCRKYLREIQGKLKFLIQLSVGFELPKGPSRQ